MSATEPAGGEATPKCPVTKSVEEYRGAREDGPAKCTWHPGISAEEKATDPHIHVPHKPRAKILDNILGAIGNTPLVRINNITREEGVEAELLAKCEYFSAGGSVKDRIGYRMIVDAENSGRIKPGDTLIEPTSGNTGIGLALAAALKGYRMIITLPEKMSQEKVDVLKALGAEIIRTPTEAAFDSPESHIGVAKRLQAEIPNAHILDQYGNPSNPMAHYDTTAEEIWESCEGKIDMVILSAGTGGTLTGIARKLKERNPAIIVVGIDPKGSILAEPEQLNDEKRLQSYAVEGIGYDFIPAVLDRSLVDMWLKTEDRESFIMSRRLIRQEGLLVGGSAGSAMAGAIVAAKTLKKGQRAVVLLADGVRNYMSKFLSDDWMWRNGFVDPERNIGTGNEHHGAWWASRTVADLGVAQPVTVTPAITCKEAVSLLTSMGFDQLPVVDESNAILGVITEGNLTAKLMAGRISPSDSVTKALFPQFRRVSVATKLGELARIFDRDHFAVVLQTQRCFSGKTNADGTPSMTEKSLVVAVVTRIDLLAYIAAHDAAGVPTPRPSPASTLSAASAEEVHSSGAAAVGAAAGGGAAVCPVTGRSQ